jgi:glycosyltransferase involved in cell wall biosynthesis
MNILHVIDWAGFGGGAEVVAFDAANSLPANNYLYYYQELPSFSTDEFAQLTNIKIIKARRKCSLFNLLPNVVELKKLIKEYNIDIVHSQLFWSNLTARLATPPSKKLFTHIHNIQSKSSLQSKKAQLFERLTYSKHETTFCVSEEVNKDYKKIVPFANTVTLYNFIGDRFFKNGFPAQISRDGDKIKLIAVGTVKPQKNYKLLIEAFAELKRRGRKDIYLDVYGKGEDIPVFQKQVEELGINVAFKGESLNLEEIYPQYDGFIMASLYEGYGLSIIEAFASRLPALLSDISVIREVTNSNGIFFNPESVDDCVEKILNFSDNKYNTHELVEREYSWAKKIAQKSAYIDKLLHYYNK